MSKFTKSERSVALQALKELLHPGDIVYTTVQHVSRSGMMRVISVKVIQDNYPRDISLAVAKVIDCPYNSKHDGVRMDGCGMDMGFQTVYQLSYHLFPDGFTCIGYDKDAPRTICPSNDHHNGDRDYTPHLHTSGGYALRQAWM